MFTPTELQLIRKKSPTDFDALLSRLAIAIDNTSGDEYRIYEKIDDDLTRKLSALMKSPSVIAGYTTLLELGGIVYDYSETDNELLAKIVANREKILDAVRTQAAQYNNQAATYDSWQARWGNVLPVPERVEVLSVDAFDMKPFDKDKLIDKFDEIKESYNKYLSSAREAADKCIAAAKNLRELFELKSEIPFEDISELLRKVSMPLHDDKERVICLRIKKRIQFTKKKIPPAPDKPSAPLFTVRKAEDVLNILEQLNHVVSAKG